MKIFIFLFFFTLIPGITRSQGNLQFTLPPHIYCNPYAEISVYYKNLIYNPESSRYTFKISHIKGLKSPEKFTFDCFRKSFGDSRMRVKVFNARGSAVARGRTDVHFSIIKKAPADSTKILIIGNSLTAAGYYPAKVQSFLLDSVHFPVRFLGTRTSHGGIHEGYGGKTWKWFGHHGDSPFVFKTAKKDSVLDFGRYFREVVHDTPDIAVIFLGINDCFRADTTSVETIDKTIDGMLAEATFFLNKLIAYKPDLRIGICLTPPANDRVGAFSHNYRDKYTRSGWEKIQRRLVERYITFFADHFQANCSLIPVEINIDTYSGYPDDNAVHPNVYGYHQIAASIFSWIYYELGR